MKYVVLIYSNPATWAHPMFLHQRDPLSEQETQVQVQEFTTLMREISASGELVDSAPLAAPELSRTIRVRDGALTATDGPFADAKEQMAGYFVLDCATRQRAEEIAARFPDARHGGVELRPIADVGPPVER